MKVQLRVFIAIILFLLVSYVPQGLWADTEQEMIEQKIQSGLNDALQRPNRTIDTHFSGCRLKVTEVFSNSCSVKFKVAKSDVTISLQEVNLIERVTANGRTLLKFWFEDQIQKKLETRRDKSALSDRPKPDDVLFEEHYFYCDGSLAPSRSVSANKSFFLSFDDPSLVKKIKRYNKKFCSPAANL